MNPHHAHLRDYTYGMAIILVLSAVLLGASVAARVAAAGGVVLFLLWVLQVLSARFVNEIVDEQSSGGNGIVLGARLLFSVPMYFALIKLLGPVPVMLAVSSVAVGSVLSVAVHLVHTPHAGWFTPFRVSE